MTGATVPARARARSRVAFQSGLMFLLCASPALATPDLRQPRLAGPLTVYADEVRRNLFYYPPGDLAIAVGDEGEPDIHLLHARYTGSAAMGDRGTAVVRSILTLRVVMAGPTPPELAEARKALVAAAGGPIELRPLPIRRLESAIVYAPIAPAGAPDTAPPVASPDVRPPQPLPPGHFEASDAPAPLPDSYWTERIYTLGLPPEDAQLLSNALERGLLVLSVGYAFFADGIGPDQPLQELSGSPALVSALKKTIAPATGSDDRAGDAAGPHIVRTGAIGVTADLARWPQLVRRVDINESAPPGYAALDVYCYDFAQGGESPLYEKQVEIEADGVGGRRVKLAASFSRSQPDLYARSLRFPVAVRLDRPYRFRVLEIAQDGTSTTTPWREQASWTELLDVTARGDHR